MNELVPCELSDLAEKTFIAVDTAGGSRLVGTVKRLNKHTLVVVLAGANPRNTTIIDHEAIKQLYFAPMGYRP